MSVVVQGWSLIMHNPQSVGTCIEATAGILQLALIWVLFTFMYVVCCIRAVPRAYVVYSMVLYMIYYPPHLKYAEVDVDLHNHQPLLHVKTGVKRDEWRLSITLSWVVLLYTCVGLHTVTANLHS